MFICTTNLYKKIGPLSLIATEKIAFPPKPDGHKYIHTDKHTYRRTDISVYRVSSLLIKSNIWREKIIYDKVFYPGGKRERGQFLGAKLL